MSGQAKMPTSSIWAGPGHDTEARTGSRMQAVKGHSAPSSAYSASFSRIRVAPCEHCSSCLDMTNHDSTSWTDFVW